MSGVLFDGVIHVSGEPDSGKSSFGFSTGALPEKMAFIDDDVKGINFVKQVEEQGSKLGFYINLINEGESLKEIGFHNKCLEIIETLSTLAKKNGRFDVLLWDTWTRFENTFHPYVNANPGYFRSKWSPKGDIKGAEEWKESFNYESAIINRLQGIARMVILTTHLKPENIAGRRTGKMIPDCKLPLVQKPVLRVYLRHNPDSPEPIGLILKRPSKQVVTKDGIKIVSVLPRKMKPFTWDAIRHYWDNPVGNRKLEESESPDEYELSILDGVLTLDQKEVLRLHDKPPLFSDNDEEVVTPAEQKDSSNNSGIVEKVLDLKSKGKSNPVIAKELELSVRDVASILRANA